MKFLIDFGSTFTKVVVVDLENEEIVSRTQAPSTVGVDIMIGLREALERAEIEVDVLNPEKEDILACSSAAGGLRMDSVGLVPELSLEAATCAALGAGAKVINAYSYTLTQQEIDEIENASPDIILLAGGTDGGNRKVIVHNAEMLAKSRVSAPVIMAGNKTAQDEIKSILTASGKHVEIAKNVMPEVNRLEVDSCREVIRKVFMGNIIKAKGIDRVRRIVKDVIMPTPAAVLNAAKLLAEGFDGEGGMGEIVVVDVGGATTDVYSVAGGEPSRGGIILKELLPEPYAKRTVEGDLGVRHNLDVLLRLGRQRGLLPDNSDFGEFKNKFSIPGKLPENSEESAFDLALARTAVDVAVERHVGKIEVLYGPIGEMLVQSGKDLTRVKCVIGTGGPVVFAQDPLAVLKGCAFDGKKSPNLLKPKEPDFYIDDHYILYAIGLLAESEPKKALTLMKKHLRKFS